MQIPCISKPRADGCYVSFSLFLISQLNIGCTWLLFLGCLINSTRFIDYYHSTTIIRSKLGHNPTMELDFIPYQRHVWYQDVYFKTTCTQWTQNIKQTVKGMIIWCSLIICTLEQLAQINWSRVMDVIHCVDINMAAVCLQWSISLSSYHVDGVHALKN